MEETMHLHPAELAVMCVLMLRGAQTAGEIRTRTARMFQFGDLEQVGITLQALMTLAEPLVTELPRQPGRKEARYVHLLSGVPELLTEEQPQVDPVQPDRIEALERVVDSLREEVAQLRSSLDEFKRQFQ
jgi:uncharacterized protein YceH (UPF0502 family)